MLIRKILKPETRKAMFNLALDVETKRLSPLIKVQKRIRRKGHVKRKEN